MTLQRTGPPGQRVFARFGVLIDEDWNRKMEYFARGDDAEFTFGIQVSRPFGRLMPIR